MNMNMNVYQVTSLELSEIRTSTLGGATRTITIESILDGKPSILEITCFSPDKDESDLERKMLEIAL